MRHPYGEDVLAPGRHSGERRSLEPGISRFRVWSFGPSRNDSGCSPFSHGWYATTPVMSGEPRIMRAAVAIIGLLALGGCAAEAPIEQPSMYLSMANGGAKLDPQAAASMISLYRQNNGLGGLTVDPALMNLA